MRLKICSVGFFITVCPDSFLLYDEKAKTVLKNGRISKMTVKKTSVGIHGAFLGRCIIRVRYFTHFHRRTFMHLCIKAERQTGALPVFAVSVFILFGVFKMLFGFFNNNCKNYTADNKYGNAGV